MKMVAVLTVLGLGGLLQVSSATESATVGVLVGLHHRSDAVLSFPPSGGSLRTVWIRDGKSAHSRGPERVDVPDLLLPRASGFWRAGLLATCAEDVDDDGGSNADLSDYLWFAAPGRTPTVTIRPQTPLYPTERIGPCRARTVRCVDDQRTGIEWVWPHYASINLGVEGGCGAHPYMASALTLRRINDPSRPVPIAEILDSGAARRFREAFDAARREHFAEQCKGWTDGTKFDPLSWTIVRQPGRWRLEGWTETARLCGYGFDYTADVDLSRITGRSGDDAETLARVMAKSPTVKDAHRGPSGLVLAVTRTELLLMQNATLDRIAVRVPIEPDDTVIMVEWATGAHVDRWSSAARKARTASRLKPRVTRPAPLDH